MLEFITPIRYYPDRLRGPVELEISVIWRLRILIRFPLLLGQNLTAVSEEHLA